MQFSKRDLRIGNATHVPSGHYRLVCIEQLNRISRGCQRNSPYWLGSDRGTVLARQDTTDKNINQNAV